MASDAAALPDAPAPATGEDFSLRTKVILAVSATSLIPLTFLALHAVSAYSRFAALALSLAPDPAHQALINAEFASAVRSLIAYCAIDVLLIAGGIFAADRFLARPVRLLSAWLARNRAALFAAVDPAPVTSHDELGNLAYDIEQSIKYLHDVEAREHQIVEEKGEFIAVAAHQLRTPLTGIKWVIETVRSAHAGVPTAELLAQLSASTDRMSRIVEDVLNAVRIEEGKFGYEYAIVDIVRPVEKLVGEFELLARDRRIALRFVSAERAMPAYVDSNRLLIAISNLLSNAIDYSHAGGSVTLSLVNEGRLIRISVVDTGMGIAAQDQKRLFTKFYRGENARHARPDGSGLGLYIARNIARRHGSEITVASEVEKGTAFSFTVPKEKLDLGKDQPTVATFFAGV